MNHAPLLSIIVPTHKRADLLARNLQSLKAQQGDLPFEIIVVSDLADPATTQVCDALLGPMDIFARRNGPPGPAQSRNLGLSLAGGQVVMFLDDDDAWHPGVLNHLQNCAPLHQGSPVYFNCSRVVERRLAEGSELISETQFKLDRNLTEGVYLKNQIHLSCFAFPRPLIEDIRFDPSMRAYEDWDFLLSVFDRRLPVHVDALVSRIFEVSEDSSTDRRGSTQGAIDFNSVLDYLYVYRRHPVNPALAAKRAALMQTCGLSLGADLL